MKRLAAVVGLLALLLGVSADAADTVYYQRTDSGHTISRRAVDMADGTWAEKVILGAGSTATTTPTQSSGAGQARFPWAITPVQGAALFNSHATGAANTAVTATITGVANQRALLHSVQAFCSAGTASLTVTDGGTTIWATPAAAVGTAQFLREWATGLTAATGNTLVVTLGACGVGNTGTLTVQASQF
jgi:hypothetical protein